MSTSDNPKQIFASVEYGENLHQTIKKEFKKHNITLACKTNNNLGKVLSVHKRKTEKFNNAGVYKLNCSDCDMFYVGKTNRKFKTRFSEHLPNKKQITQRSKLAEHLVNNKHNISNISTNMNILHKCRNSRLTSTLE